MKKITYFLTIFFVGASLSLAQNDLVTIELPESSVENIEFSKSWNFIFNTDDKELTINGGKITNKSTNSNTGHLKLEYYLVTENSLSNETSKQGYFITELDFNPIKKRTANANISITGNLSSTLPNGKYYPLLILYERRFGEYLPVDFTLQNSKALHVLNNELTFKEVEEEEEEEIIEVIEQEESTIPKESEIVIENKSEKILLSFTNDLTLSGTWEINIDFQKFLVEINGDAILNNHYSSNGRPMKLKLYMNKDKFTKDSSKFEGYLIAEAPIGNLLPDTSSNSPKIKMNLQRIIPQGLYFPLLVLSEDGENGETIIKAVRVFNNMVKL